VIDLANALRVLRILLATAILVSVVHYVDNVVNYGDYPVPTSGPAPSRAVVGIAWFVFTPFGIAGYLLLRGGRARPAAACLGVYSGSGLVRLGRSGRPRGGERGKFRWSPD